VLVVLLSFVLFLRHEFCIQSNISSHYLILRQ
jgi:hypothetical protein